MTTKTIDAIEMKRRGAEKIYQQIATMTVEQQVAFWQQRTDVLLQQQRNAVVQQPEQQIVIEPGSATGAPH